MQEDVANGAYSSADEFVRRAVAEFIERRRLQSASSPVQPTDDGWNWLREMWADGATLDADVVAAVNEDVPEQARPELDKLFS